MQAGSVDMVILLLNRLADCCKQMNNSFHLEYLRLQNMVEQFVLCSDEVGME